MRNALTVDVEDYFHVAALVRHIDPSSRAASYSITKRSLWALDILAERGFAYDSSIFPVHHDRYGIPDSPRWPYRLDTPSGGSLIEFPPSTLEIGGYRLPKLWVFSLMSNILDYDTPTNHTGV